MLKKMRFWQNIRIAGALVLVLGLQLGITLLGAGNAAAQTSSSTAQNSSPSNLVGVQGNSSQLNSAQSNAASNGSSSFATQGNLGNSGANAPQLPSGVLPYLAASPELNGPGSLQWCVARSSCSQAATQCSNECQTNTAANGTSQSDSGDTGVASQTTGDAGESQISSTITNFAANDCNAVCQDNYNSCSNQASSACAMGQ
jgi:hypothetical protein